MQYLSAEWCQAVQETLNASEDFKKAASGVQLSVQQNITGAPQGEVTYYMNVAAGAVACALGPADAPDVTIGQEYATAVAVNKGELNAQQAFMTGKLKATGNLMKLMQHAGAFQSLDGILRNLDVEY